jgi:hypothetical protein
MSSLRDWQNHKTCSDLDLPTPEGCLDMAFNHERSMIAINPTPKECKDYRGVRIIEHPTIEINPTPKGCKDYRTFNDGRST